MKLGESHSKVDDDHEDYKIEIHYESMHKDEEDEKKITKREVEASMCETERESI